MEAAAGERGLAGGAGDERLACGVGSGQALEQEAQRGRDGEPLRRSRGSLRASARRRSVRRQAWSVALQLGKSRARARNIDSQISVMACRALVPEGLRRAAPSAAQRPCAAIVATGCAGRRCRRRAGAGRRRARRTWRAGCARRCRERGAFATEGHRHGVRSSNAAEPRDTPLLAALTASTPSSRRIFCTPWMV